MSKIIEWNEAFKKKITMKEIMRVAIESDEPVIQDLITQLAVMTKLLHPEEVTTKVNSILASYGFLEVISVDSD